MRTTWIDGEEVATFSVGSIGQRFPLFELNDDEIEEELEEARAKAARRVSLGFHAPSKKRRTRIGGRVAGTFPRVGRL